MFFFVNSKGEKMKNEYSSRIIICSFRSIALKSVKNHDQLTPWTSLFLIRSTIDRDTRVR